MCFSNEFGYVDSCKMMDRFVERRWVRDGGCGFMYGVDGVWRRRRDGY